MPIRRAHTMAHYAPAVPVRLAADADDDESAPKWIQVAVEGEFRGHHQGPFAFDRSTFETIVANFRKHPSYRKGKSGQGEADVIPFDFHHASEAEPTRGDIAAVGAPAQAWAQDLEVRTGPSGAELWALTRYLEPARTYVREGRYRWTSVAVWFDATDPVTNEPIGPTLTSIAFTNQPFLRGMTPIAASRRAGAYRYDPYDAPGTPIDALGALRELFELPATSGVLEIVGQMAKLRAWVTGGGAPVGVDAGHMLGCIRRILNLPTLSSGEQVFAEADKLLASLAREALPPPAAPEPQNEPILTGGTPGSGARAPGDQQMDIKTLAKQLGVKETDEAVTVALEAGVKARGSVATILAALGVTEDKALETITELRQAKAEHDKQKLELEQLRKWKAEAQAKVEEQDVDEAISGYQLDESLREPLLLYRRAQPEAFAGKYPRLEASRSHLAQAVHTPPPPAVERRLAGQDGRVRFDAAARIGQRVDLSAAAGRNRHERAMNFLRAQPGGDKLSFDELHLRASEMLDSMGGAQA